jgi:hypothetical protein
LIFFSVFVLTVLWSQIKEGVARGLLSKKVLNKKTERTQQNNKAFRMSHHFEKQHDGSMACSQCGKTEEFLSSKAGVDGRKPPCPDAPLGN